MLLSGSGSGSFRRRTAADAGWGAGRGQLRRFTFYRATGTALPILLPDCGTGIICRNGLSLSDRDFVPSYFGPGNGGTLFPDQSGDGAAGKLLQRGGQRLYFSVVFPAVSQVSPFRSGRGPVDGSASGGGKKGNRLSSSPFSGKTAAGRCLRGRGIQQVLFLPPVPAGNRPFHWGIPPISALCQCPSAIGKRRV